jgi:transcription antitermination factor NusG
MRAGMADRMSARRAAVKVVEINIDRTALTHGAMPLLAKQPEIAPEEIFSLGDDQPWRVAHVQSRQEKALARHLLRQDIPFYLPQVERTVLRAGRRFVSYLPLFPGYVFFRGPDGARQAVLRSGVTASVIGVEDQQLLARELCQIRELQRSGASLIPTDELAAGDPVEISDGPFRGYVGVVMRESNGERLIVSVSLLRKSISVNFDPSVLKRRRT